MINLEKKLNQPERLSRLSFDHRRLLNAFVSVIYVAVLILVYRDYISVEHELAAGMHYRYISLYHYGFIYASVSLLGFCIPPEINRPSSAFIWFLFIFYTAPSLAFTFYIGENDPKYYYAALISLVAAMFLLIFITKFNVKYKVSERITCDHKFTNTVSVIWILFTVLLILQFRSIMSFAGIDEIYAQRSMARELDTGGLVSYVRTHYSYVINPILICAGLIKKRYYLLMIGIIGTVITFMIDAQKMVFILLIGMFGFYFLLSRSIRSSWIYTAAITFFCLVVTLMVGHSSLFTYVADVTLLRAIAIPGGSFAQYYDLFSSTGYTYWSSITGVNLFVQPPAIYVYDPAWPQLGVIVGREYFPLVEGLNNSASGFSGEGVAAAGSLGVLVIGAAMGGFFRVLDYASRNWNQLFVIVALVPIAMALANAHLSTVLVSFGGLAWLIILSSYQSTKNA